MNADKVKLDLIPGRRIIILEHWRARGAVGGWRDHEQEHQILKVNPATVQTMRVLPHGILSGPFTTRKERILGLKK